MPTVGITTLSIEDKGFTEVHTNKSNEAEFSKNISRNDSENKVARMRVFRDPNNQQSAIVHTWKEDYDTGEVKEHKSYGAVPDSPRIKAKLGI